MNNDPNKNPIVGIIASDKTWIEGKAIEQLHETARLPGMINVVGLPDLHPGKGSPIGAAFLSQGILYPYLVGSDIGCGMGLYQTELHKKKMKLDRWEKKLTGLESPAEPDLDGYIGNGTRKATPFDESLGTIGGGNHFAELQTIEKVYDPEGMAQLKLDADHLVLLIHSGSRGFGHHILQEHIQLFGAQGLQYPSKEASAYLESHEQAMQWAKLNRQIIASRFCSLLGSSFTPSLDIWHNSVVKTETEAGTCWLHRKGAAPSDRGPVVIPGSRGSLSFLVKPIGNKGSSNFSLAHGAGRKWNRSECKARLKEKFKVKDLTRTSLGSRVICENKSLLYQEAPQAYKNIDHIIETLMEANLIELIATFRPVITYKTRKD